MMEFTIIAKACTSVGFLRFLCTNKHFSNGPGPEVLGDVVSSLGPVQPVGQVGHLPYHYSPFDTCVPDMNNNDNNTR